MGGARDLPGVLRNGRPGAPHILNVSFTGVEGESLFAGLPELMLSTGSACNSRSGEPSYVLRALGRDSEQAQSSLRFSFGYGTTEGRHRRAPSRAVRARACRAVERLAGAGPVPDAGPR